MQYVDHEAEALALVGLEGIQEPQGLQAQGAAPHHLRHQAQGAARQALVLAPLAAEGLVLETKEVELLVPVGPLVTVKAAAAAAAAAVAAVARLAREMVQVVEAEPLVPVGHSVRRQMSALQRPQPQLPRRTLMAGLVLRVPHQVAVICTPAIADFRQHWVLVTTLAVTLLSAMAPSARNSEYHLLVSLTLRKLQANSIRIVLR